MNKSSAITPPKINQAAGITYFYFLCQKDGLMSLSDKLAAKTHEKFSLWGNP